MKMEQQTRFGGEEPARTVRSGVRPFDDHGTVAVCLGDIEKEVIGQIPYHGVQRTIGMRT